MLVVSPVLVPLVTAVLTVLLHRQPRVQQAASIAGAAALLVCALWLIETISADGVVAVAMGSWPLPFAIELVADRLSVIMVLVTAVLGLGVLVYQCGSQESMHASDMLHPLVHGLLAAVCGTVLTADLFNLYVWFEVLLISSFVLITFGCSRDQLRGGIKYLAMNLIGS